MVVAALVSACQGAGDPSSAGGAATAIAGLEVSCSQASAGRYLVDVVGQAGNPPVRFEFSAASGGGVALRWGAHEQLLASVTLPTTCAPLLQLAATYYQDLPKLERAGSTSAETPLDSWGCDTTIPQAILQTIQIFLFGYPGPLDLSSCGPSGQCCDTHDVCYAQNQCDASSWLHTSYCIALGINAYSCFTACDMCNVNAAGCFFGNSVGPSSCCSPSCNVCGIPRNPANPVSGCVADCQCPNGLACDRSTGQCQAPRPPGFCGDFFCDTQFNAENCSTCPFDCGCSYPNTCSLGACVPPGSSCGNGVCDANETCSSCPGDCRCNANETCSNGACVYSGLCGGVGSPCSSSSDCCTGYNCTNATCSDPSCPSGRYCDPDASYDCGDQLHSYCDYATLCCIEI